METVCALLAILSAFVGGYLAGRSITLSPLLVTGGGLLVGIGAVLLFFIVTMTIGHLVPEALEPWLVGIHLIFVGIVAPLGGALVAFVTHRRLVRADAARLPF
jgi:putative exporter of polyketide antibiotics